MKDCPVCSTQNEDTAEYCTECGIDLTAVEVKLTPEEDDVVAEVEKAAEVEAPDSEPSDPIVGEEASDEGEAGEPESTDPAGDVVAATESDADADGDLAGPHLVVVTTGDKIPLTKPEMVIGREDPISNIFPDIDTTPFGGLEGGVSRKHAKLIEAEGEYSIEDLNSTNYTLVNKEKQEPASPRKLIAGDEIRLGRVAMLYML